MELFTFSLHISVSSHSSLQSAGDGEHELLREQRTSQVSCVSSACCATEGTWAASTAAAIGSCSFSPFDDIVAGSCCFACPMGTRRRSAGCRSRALDRKGVFRVVHEEASRELKQHYTP
jgi:hypothetical protein